MVDQTAECGHDAVGLHHVIQYVLDQVPATLHVLPYRDRGAVEYLLNVVYRSLVQHRLFDLGLQVLVVQGCREVGFDILVEDGHFGRFHVEVRHVVIQQPLLIPLCEGEVRILVEHVVLAVLDEQRYARQSFGDQGFQLDHPVHADLLKSSVRLPVQHLSQSDHLQCIRNHKYRSLSCLFAIAARSPLPWRMAQKEKGGEACAPPPSTLHYVPTLTRSLPARPKG